MVSPADFLTYQRYVAVEMEKLGVRITQLEMSKGSGKGGKRLHEQVFGSMYKSLVLTIDIANKPEKFWEWSLSFKDFMEPYITDLVDYLKTIEVKTDPIPLEESVRSLGEENNRILFRTLIMTTSDVPRRNIREVNRSGLEAWRAFNHSYDPITPQRNVDEMRD